MRPEGSDQTKARPDYSVAAVTSHLADLENLLPDFFVLGELLEVIDGEHVGRCGSNLLQRFDVRMRRRFSGLCPGSLAFLAKGPPGPQQRPHRMGGILQYRDRAAYFTHAFAKQRLNRRAFLHSRRKMVRIASEADGLLAGYQELDQIRMAAMKLDLVR